MAETNATDYRIAWEPQSGPQTHLITCPVFEQFFGGARGGGKTDGVLGEFASHAGECGKAAIGLMVRRARTQLIEAIERSRAIYQPLGAVFHEQEKMWRFPNGARLRFAFLERDADADNYQGHSYTRVIGEELGTFPSSSPILKLMATLRSAHGAPCKFLGTGNPGGPGHSWVKARYIDPAPLGYEIIVSEFTNPFNGRKLTKERVFIPSKVTDNKYLGDSYIANLSQVGSEELVRAWLQGDWNVIAGAYFTEFSAEHIIEPFLIPKHWTRIGGFDWGTATPYAFLAGAVSDGTPVENAYGQTCIYPAGSIIIYLEECGYDEEALQQGIRKGTYLSTKEMGERIKWKLRDDKLGYIAADPSIFAKKGKASDAEDMQSIGLYMREGANSRVQGWSQVRKRLKGIDGVPYLYFFKTCKHIIRVLPALPHDPNDANDVDTDADDDPADALRYMCMERPWTTKLPAPTKEFLLPSDIRVMDVVNSHLKRAKSRRGYR